MGIPHAQTDFTSRLTMCMLPDVANLIETVNRLAVMVETLAKEHGVPVPTDIADAIANVRGAK